MKCYLSFWQSIPSFTVEIICSNPVAWFRCWCSSSTSSASSSSSTTARAAAVFPWMGGQLKHTHNDDNNNNNNNSRNSNRKQHRMWDTATLGMSHSIRLRCRCAFTGWLGKSSLRSEPCIIDEVMGSDGMALTRSLWVGLLRRRCKRDPVWWQAISNPQATQSCLPACLSTPGFASVVDSIADVVLHSSTVWIAPKLSNCEHKVLKNSSTAEGSFEGNDDDD